MSELAQALRPYQELHEYCGVLEDRAAELETRVRAYELTIEARNAELKRLRQGLIELAFAFPNLKRFADDLRMGL